MGCTDVKYRFKIGLDLHTCIALEVKGHMDIIDKGSIIEHVRCQPRTQALYSVLPKSLEERPGFRLVTGSGKIKIFN